MLNISRATLFRLVKNGEIQGKKFGRRRVFSIVELQKLLA
jgi:excisionase family DNA binding protein